MYFSFPTCFYLSLQNLKKARIPANKRGNQEELTPVNKIKLTNWTSTKYFIFFLTNLEIIWLPAGKQMSYTNVQLHKGSYIMTITEMFTILFGWWWFKICKSEIETTFVEGPYPAFPLILRENPAFRTVSSSLSRIPFFFPRKCIKKSNFYKR